MIMLFRRGETREVSMTDEKVVFTPAEYMDSFDRSPLRTACPS
jgi:hypothetical protein